VIIMADSNASPGLPTTVQQGLVRNYIRDPKRGPPDAPYVRSLHLHTKSELRWALPKSYRD